MLRDLLVLVSTAPFLAYIAYRDARYRLIPLWSFIVAIALGTAVNTWYVLTHGLTALQKIQLAFSLILAGAFTLLSIYYSDVVGFGDVLAVLTAVETYPFTEQTTSLLLAIAPATVTILASIIALDICAVRKCTKKFPFATAITTATLAYGITLIFIE
ncbi:MAG: prepilin peptidase [Ignisphaera sp.]|nr:prepilin peptidase [Ignisphaera sp.]